MTLTEFLLARVAVDETIANDHHVRGCGMSDDPEDCPPTYFPGVVGVCDCTQRRVLAECEAKRRIVERYKDLGSHGDTGDARWVLPLLALPYTDHPDYQPEWRP